MSVTINSKGTSVSSFAIGKGGMSLGQTGTITPPNGNDLVISLADEKNVIVDAGTGGPALITTTHDQDLNINPAVGGGQHLVLVANRWPSADGVNGQVLMTNGSGVLSWTNLPSPGTNLTIELVSGTTQSAISGYQYVLTNTGASTTVTLPASPTNGDIIWITNTTSRTDHVIDRNGQNIIGLAQNMTIDTANANIRLRFISTIGWWLV